MSSMQMTINFERRLCKVKDEYGYFHTWEQYSQPVEASLMIGGHPGGIVSFIMGIVEFSDGSVKRVPIESIQFVDDVNEELKLHKESSNSETKFDAKKVMADLFADDFEGCEKNE